MDFDAWRQADHGCGSGPCKGCANGGVHDWDTCSCHDEVRP